jgi:lysophospholipase L1-like esterase
MSTRKIALALLLGAGLLLFVLTNLIANPGPLRIEVNEGDAHVLFEADRRTISKSGDCVTVRWQTENIRTIYYNDEPTIGVGDRSACIDGRSLPTLSVELQDGSRHVYQLGITSAFSDPIVWVLGFFSVMLLFTGGYLLAAPLVSKGISGGRAIVRNMGRGVALFAFGILGTLLLLELGMRFYFNTFGSEQDRVLYTYSASEIQEKGGRFIGLPYVGYGPSPYYPEHNAFGYRGEDFAIPKPDGVFRIVTLGASTTYGFGVQPEEAYPAQLQKILREDYGYENVEVLNGGVMGYTSWETLANFAFRALETQPDLIIFYEATNDVEVRAKSPACYHQISPLLGLNVFHGLWKTSYDNVSPSTLYRFVAVNLGWIPNPNALEFAFAAPVVQKDCEEAEPISQEAAITQNPPVYYERNLRNLIALAQANGVEVMMSHFIYPTGDLVDFALPEFWQAAIEEHNVIAERLADEMDVHYYDLAADFEYDADNWWSAVHLTAKGTHLQAELYAQYLVENGLIP